VVAFLDRRHERSPDLRRAVARAQRRLELRLLDGQRRAQLVARLGDEAALALERATEALEHVVERRSEPEYLVARRRQRQLVPGVGEREPLGATAHRLDRREPRGREPIADERGEQDRDRAARRERQHEPGERVVAVLERLSDDHDASPAARRGTGQDARAALDPGNAPLDDERPALRPGHGGAAEHRPARAARRDHQPTSGRDDLGEALVGLAGHVAEPRPTPCRGRAQASGDRLGARPEARVDRLVEVRAHRQEDEHAGSREHDRHRERERGGQPGAYRQPGHVPPSLRRR